MFGPTAYLRWASRFYGSVELDLASSGMTPLSIAELGVPAALDDPRAWDRLKAHVARYNGVAVEEALPAMGTTHALWLAYASLLSPGDEALVESPTYEPMLRIAEGCGARIARFDRPLASGCTIDVSEVLHRLTERTRVVAVTNPHNPSGVRLSDESLRALAAALALRGTALLVDEVYAPFDALCGADGVWGRSARRLGPNVVAVASLTKCYGLGAHRIGWVLGPPELLARAEDAWTSTIGHAPSPWTAFACRAFERLALSADRARGIFAGKRERVRHWVEARSLRWSGPTDGLFGFVSPDALAGEDLTSRIERGVAAHGVLVAPGAFFGAPSGFRLGWSIDGAKLDEALARLERVLGGPSSS